MLDYYFNIREKSSSKAPFNMWPHQLKFYLTRPRKIYSSIIKEDNTIQTNIFLPDTKNADRVKFSTFAKANTFNLNNLNDIVQKFSIPIIGKMKKDNILASIDKWLEQNDDKYELFVDEMAKSIYLPLIKKYKHEIPKEYFYIIKEEELV